MEIRNSLPPIQPPTAPALSVPASAASSTTTSAPVDKTSVGLATAIDQTQQMFAENNQSRIQDLANLVKSGAYQPQPQQIASEILNEAELDSELAGEI